MPRSLRCAQRQCVWANAALERLSTDVAPSTLSRHLTCSHNVGCSVKTYVGQCQCGEAKNCVDRPKTRGDPNKKLSLGLNIGERAWNGQTTKRGLAGWERQAGSFTWGEHNVSKYRVLNVRTDLDCAAAGD